jgi:hypothetical protein
MSNRSLRILVSGRLAGVPNQGGASWAVLQYVLGLKRLGHDVYLVEPVARESLGACAGHFQRVAAEFGIGERSTLLGQGGRETYGLSYDSLLELARTSDALLNISGLLRDEAILGRISVRAYVDLDPVFTQLWHSNGIDVGLGGHTHHTTIGHALAASDWPLPNAGVRWTATFQPVVLQEWAVADELRYEALTTVANWRGYGSIQHEGVHYGQKAHSFRRHLALPLLVRQRFLLALAIDPGEAGDLSALQRNRWELIDPVEAAGTPARYRRFVQGSWAELGIAKSGYVVSKCSWFSDRSACYLASGRPVIAQDTGFGRVLPVGEGLFAFETDDDVVAGIEELRGDYELHARAARALAEEHFDSDKVLSRLLDRLGEAS